MSILNVEHLTHGFGDRAIFNDVSFRLLKGEHIGLVGANGEGKSTFFNIVTGKLMPDEGKIEWAKNVRVGYLDQHSVLSQGMSIRDVLKSAFSYLFEMEERMNEICDSLGTASPEEMDTLMEELGTIQDTLTMHDFYVIDAKVEEVARALGLLDIGLERDVTDLSGGQRTKVLLGKLLLEKPDILLLDEPTNYLDEEHIEWLKRYLQDYENAFTDSSRGIVKCFRIVLTRHQYLTVTDEAIKRTIGKTLEESFSILTGITNPAQLEAFRQEYRLEADVHMNVNTRLFPDTLSTLKELKKRGARVGIISTKYRFRILSYLEEFLPKDFLDIVVGGEDVKAPKPSPEGVKFALEHLGSSPEETLYIGDSTVDAETAQNAGVDFAGVLNGMTTGEELRVYPHKIIMQNLGELVQ